MDLLIQEYDEMILMQAMESTTVDLGIQSRPTSGLVQRLASIESRLMGYTEAMRWGLIEGGQVWICFIRSFLGYQYTDGATLLDDEMRLYIFMESTKACLGIQSVFVAIVW